MCAWSTAGFLKKFVSNILNETFAQTSGVHRAGSIPCNGFAVCVLPMVVRPHCEVTMINSDSVIAGMIMNFATRVVACSFCSPIGASRDQNMAKLASKPLPNIAIITGCSGTILGFIENIPRMHFSIDAVRIIHLPTGSGDSEPRFEPAGLLFCSTNGITP